MRKSKQDWLEAGLKTLGEFGVKGLTIEKLTGELGVTKGSFYHHFRDVEDFREQLIAFWADQYLSTASNLPDDPGELIALLDAIMEDGFGSITEPEIAIRVWAQQDNMVGSYVEQVDSVRQDFLLKVFRSMVGDDEQAHMMADIFSTMLIGSITVLPRVSPERVMDLYREFKRLYRL
jgi:AcrR family transcriptional regulator